MQVFTLRVRPAPAAGPVGTLAHLVMNNMVGRYKRDIDAALPAHTDGRRTTEVAIAGYALIRMLELGRSDYVRVV